MDYGQIAAVLGGAVAALSIVVILVARNRARKKAPTHPRMRKVDRWTSDRIPEDLMTSIFDCLRSMDARVTVEESTIMANFGSNDSYRTWGPTSIKGGKSFPLHLTLRLSPRDNGSVIECEIQDDLGWYPRGIDENDGAEFEQRSDEISASIRRAIH